jgi:hypothetical protein
MKKNYVGYFLTDQSRNLLLGKFPPKFEKVFCDHITFATGHSDKNIVPESKNISVIGYKIDEGGLEVLVVSVGSTTRRPDGSIFHITHSLNPHKFSPKDSNVLLSKGYDRLDRIIRIQTFIA